MASNKNLADMARGMSAYYAGLGNFVIAWNQGENAMRQMLLTLCGPSNATHILTAELGTRGLADGLNAIAATLSAELREAVEIVVKLYERLREYRNYYVHGIVTIGFRESDGAAAGIAHMASAKGKLGFAQDQITIRDLAIMRDNALMLQRAVGTIIDTLDPQDGSAAHPPLPSKGTLPVPDRLMKTLRYPLNEQPSPQS